MDRITGEQIIAGLALIGLIILGHVLIFQQLPQNNATILATIVGALAGAVTVSAGKKAADKINSTGPGGTITTNTETPA